MRVKMLTDTYYRGEFRKKGTVHVVSDDVAIRWADKGIAATPKKKSKEGENETSRDEQGIVS